MTVAELRAKATQEAVAKAALKRELNINVTDAEAKDYYTKHPADFEQPEMVHVRHILLMTIDPATHTPLPTNTIAAKRKQIEDLLKRILRRRGFCDAGQAVFRRPRLEGQRRRTAGIFAAARWCRNLNPPRFR